jgi:ferredoxin--NADP+ reductase
MNRTHDTAVRIAVVGSGPAGFYAAGHLLKEGEEGHVEVDMLERLPTPHGLVRSGVAPDHPKIKTVTRVYEKTALHPRFRFFGNVELGRDVSVEELREHYHAIVYAVGAAADRPLGIPGESLRGSWAATDFVGWYNGHPDHRDVELDLKCERAVVIGNGNVALDVARMLTLDHDELAATDIADHALEALRESELREVIVVGRRGPAQAAFTNPELLELGEMRGVDVIVHSEELERALAVADPNMDPTRERNVKALREYARRSGAREDDAPAENAPGGGANAEGTAAGETPEGSAGGGETSEGKATGGGDATPDEDAPRRRIVLRFLLSPVEILGEEDDEDEPPRVAAVRLAHNELLADAEGRLRAVATGEHETIDAKLVLRAVGYRGRALPGVPFDERNGVILNQHGRVRDEHGRVRRGEYAVGWIKRGPTGVIGTNKKDAQETVNALLEDLAQGNALLSPPRPDPKAIEELLRARRPQLVTYEGWLEIDRHERTRGEPQGRPRVKLTRIEEMLLVASEQRPVAS